MKFLPTSSLLFSPGPQRLGALHTSVLAVAVCMALAFAAPSARSDETTDPITPAEQWLFLDNHFAKVKPPAELVYTLEKRGSLVKDSDEKVTLKTVLKAGKQVTSLTDATGALPGDAEGEIGANPVITYFLERDIKEMQTLTGGQNRYFQKRIRLALASGPAIANVTVKVGGKPVAAKQVSVQPYLGDPNAAKFAKMTSKRYTFVLSDEVPGCLVLIRTEVPAEHDNFVAPLEVETLSFEARR
jgi:hypothetical protein